MRLALSFFIICLFLPSSLFAKKVEDLFLKGDKESIIYQIESFDKKDKPKNIILLIGDGMGTVSYTHLTLPTKA